MEASKQLAANSAISSGVAFLFCTIFEGSPAQTTPLMSEGVSRSIFSPLMAEKMEAAAPRTPFLSLPA